MVHKFTILQMDSEKMLDAVEKKTGEKGLTLTKQPFFVFCLSLQSYLFLPVLLCTLDVPSPVVRFTLTYCSTT